MKKLTFMIVEIPTIILLTIIWLMLTIIYYTKDKLLENGDRWEAQIAANLEADAKYR